VPNVKDYDEINISQIPAIEVLKGLGYTYIPPEVAEMKRGNLYNVILKDILYNQLVKLNSYEYKGKNYSFSEKNINQAMEDLDEALTDGLIKTNEKILPTPETEISNSNIPNSSFVVKPYRLIISSRT